MVQKLLLIVTLSSFFMSCSNRDYSQPWEVVGINPLDSGMCEIQVVQWKKVGLPERYRFKDTCDQYFFSQKIMISEEKFGN
jgi:hypothetical protein